MAVAAGLLLSSGSFCQVKYVSQVVPAKKFQSMVGSWEIIGEQDFGGGLEIIDSATILIRYMGEEKKILEYKIDFSKSPYWFDFSAKDSTSVSSFKSLLEFVNDDMLKWQIFVDEERANHFTSTTGESFYLKRTNPKPSPILATK